VAAAFSIGAAAEFGTIAVSSAVVAVAGAETVVATVGAIGVAGVTGGMAVGAAFDAERHFHDAQAD
jgi:hypothetical protein